MYVEVVRGAYVYIRIHYKYVYCILLCPSLRKTKCKNVAPSTERREAFSEMLQIAAERLRKLYVKVGQQPIGTEV